MTAQGRGVVVWAALGGLLLGGLARAADAPPVPVHVSEALRGDAGLNDVCFVTPTCGWAVGDRGTIWHTDNGGYAWRLQESGVTCRLQSVAFLDERHGWAAGGWSHPYTHITSGVILETADGGEHWNALPRLMLPALKKLRFINGKYGWAIGCPSAMYPTGVLVTENGGRSWDPLPGLLGPPWQAGDLLDPQTGAVAGPRGAVASLRCTGLDAARTPPLGLRAATRLRLIPPGYGMLVGQGGLVLLTPDAGGTWQAPPSPLPQGLAGQCDLRALEIRGSRCWLAGAPGSCVFLTADAGRTWAVAATGQPLPLESLAFVDDQHGWAVGQLGTILATDDGGQTWKQQRGGGRVALLGLLAEADDVPLELLGKLCADEGYRSAVAVLGRQDLDTPSRAQSELPDRLHEAVLRVGGCAAETAWNFPLRPRELRLPTAQIVAAWDQVNGGRGLQELEAHLVRQIRTWRPEVLVTNDLDPQDAAGQQVAQMVLRSAELASQPTVYPEQAWPGGFGAVGGQTGLRELEERRPRLGRAFGGASGDAVGKDAARPGRPRPQFAGVAWRGGPRRLQLSSALRSARARLGRGRFLSRHRLGTRWRGAPPVGRTDRRRRDRAARHEPEAAHSAGGAGADARR